MATVIESNAKNPPRRKLSSVLLLVVTVAALVVGVGSTILYSIQNESLVAEIQQLETDLGVLDVEDPERVYFVAIEEPDVPAVIAEHAERVWQYRCYLPPKYDYSRFGGDGLVSADGFYCSGSGGASWSSPDPAAINKLMTISVTRKRERFELRVYLGNQQSGGSLRYRNLENLKLEDFVIEPVLASGQENCSFSRDDIIPILRIYDPASATEKVVAGRKRTTYSGALMLFCPASQKAATKSLRQGRPIDETQLLEGTSP